MRKKTVNLLLPIAGSILVGCAHREAATPKAEPSISVLLDQKFVSERAAVCRPEPFDEEKEYWKCDNSGSVQVQTNKESGELRLIAIRSPVSEIVKDMAPYSRRNMFVTRNASARCITLVTEGTEEKIWEDVLTKARLAYREGMPGELMTAKEKRSENLSLEGITVKIVEYKGSIDRYTLAKYLCAGVLSERGTVAVFEGKVVVEDVRESVDWVEKMIRGIEERPVDREKELEKMDE